LRGLPLGGIVGGAGDATPTAEPAATATVTETQQASEPSQEPEPTTKPEPKKTTKPAPKPEPAQRVTKREWAKVVKNPDNYIGERYILYGQVTQFDSATGDDNQVWMLRPADGNGVGRLPDVLGDQPRDDRLQPQPRLLPQLRSTASRRLPRSGQQPRIPQRADLLRATGRGTIKFPVRQRHQLARRRERLHQQQLCGLPVTGRVPARRRFRDVGPQPVPRRPERPHSGRRCVARPTRREGVLGSPAAGLLLFRRCSGTAG
jgi:hypothetical protein